VRFSMYFFVLGVLLNLRGAIPLFALHIFAAMIMVHFFTETLNAGTKSVIKNKSLVRKMNVPREMFPVASVLVTLYHAGPQYVILVVACLFLGWSPDPTAFVAGLLGIAIIVTISLAVSLAFSALNVSFRDFGQFVETIGMMVLWSAPMLYPWEFVADQLGPIGEQIYLANPVAIATLLNQRAFWVPALDEDDHWVMPDHLLMHGGIMLVCCLGLVGIAQLVFSKLEYGFAEKM
jgi:ABC-2 type transport system permease protein